MSGTSLDGVDLAYCLFEKKNENWDFEFLNTRTLPYSVYWKEKLQQAHNYSGRDLFRLDHQYGKYLGEIIRDYIAEYNLKVDLIASHGHTIFHEPALAGSLQIGNGHEIHALTGLPVISDFRSLDIALGGQGAPLVPAGDLLLFREFPYCLNLGGFSNLSYKNDGITAWDICPVNTVLNKFSQILGSECDYSGKLGKQGKFDPVLLKELNDIEFYKIAPPRSLGIEFLENIFLPVVLAFNMKPHDILATLYEHISDQISQNLNNSKADRVLVTGGGAKNDFLMQRIRQKTNNPVIVISDSLTDFKEALIFAFLGILRIRNQVNCFASVTGASQDSSCGIIYGDSSLQ